MKHNLAMSKRQYFGKKSLFIKELCLTIGLTLGTISTVQAGIDKWTAVPRIDVQEGDVYWSNFPPILNPANPDTWYLLGSAGGKDVLTTNGIFQSTNAGNSWKLLPEQVFFPGNYSIVQQLVVAPSDPQTLYLRYGTGYFYESDYDKRQVADVYKSVDGGIHWTRQTQNTKLYALTVHPKDSNILYAYSAIHQAVVKSIDGGISWQSVGLMLGDEFDERVDEYPIFGDRGIFIDPANPSLIYALIKKEISQPVEFVLQRGQENGTNWQTLKLPTVTLSGRVSGQVALAIHPTLSSLYLGLGEDLYKSEDKGNTWIKKSTNRFSHSSNENTGSGYMHRLNIDKDGKLYWFSNRELFVSLDDGVSWQKKALPNLWSFNSKTGYGEDKHIQTIMIDPRQSGVIHLVLRNTSLEHFSVEAWAILKSTDYGTTWQTPKGVKTPVAYLRTPDGSIADNGTMSIDLFSQNVRYRSNTSGGLFKSTDNGVTYQMVGSLPAGVSADGSGWGLSPINQNTLFNWGGDIASSPLYRSNDSGKTWTKIYTGTKAVLGILEHPVDANTWYVIEGTCPLGCYPSNLYKTTDGGKTRSDFGLNTLLTGTTATYSAVNSFSASGSTQYAATIMGIYQSTDGGKNWKAFSNAGFPFEPMNVLNVRSEGNALYAETSAGTFVYGKNSPATVTNAEAVGNVAINSTVKIAAYGLFLKNQTLSLNLQDCTNPTLLNEGDDMTQFFQCQMGATAGVKTGQIKDSSGTALFNFNVTATAPVSQISGVTPLIAKVSETTTFKITGSNLPQNLQFSVQDCMPVQTVAPETCTTTQCQFTCTPSSAGFKTGQIKENSGNVLFNFSVQVDAATNPITNNQCATFNPSTKPNVIIPCLSVNGQNYSAALNLMNAPTLRFEADMSLFKPITTTASADCGVFPYQNKPVVHLNCVDVGGTKYWADLNLAPSNSGAIEFDLGGASIR